MRTNKESDDSQKDTIENNDVTKNHQDSEEFEHYLSSEATNPDSDEIPYETAIVKLNWKRVILISFIIASFFTGLTFLIIWIIGLNNYSIWAFADWIFFIEFGAFMTFGGCVGTWKQSFSLNQLNVKLFKGKKMSGADTKLAIGSSYTYIIASLLLAIVSLILFLVL